MDEFSGLLDLELDHAETRAVTEASGEAAQTAGGGRVTPVRLVTPLIGSEPRRVSTVPARAGGGAHRASERHVVLTARRTCRPCRDPASCSWPSRPGVRA